MSQLYIPPSSRRDLLFRRLEMLRSLMRIVVLLMTLAPLMVVGGCRKGGGAEKEEKADEVSKEPVSVEIALVSTGSIETTVIAQGTLSPAQGASARVAAVAPGRLVDVLVREGDRVAAGQIVATIENRPQQAQSRSAAAALSASESQARQSEITARASEADHKNAVHQATLSLESAEIDRDASVKQATTTLQTAETELRKLRAGARPQEIAQAELAARQAAATRDRAATEVERVKFLFEKGIDAKRQLDDAQTAYTVAVAATESAKQQASLVKAGPRAEDIRTAELKVQQERETLDQARKSGSAKVAIAQAALKSSQQGALQVAAKRQEANAARSTVNQKAADLQSAQFTAGYAILRSPLDGVVTRRALNPGDLADTTNPVVEIANISRLNLVASLAAEDGAKVRSGMTVRISPADQPEKTISGKVMSVGQVDAQTNLMSLRITAPNPDYKLKSGSFALARIILRANQNAVIVPKQALIERDGKTVVFVSGSDNAAHLRPIVTGAEDGNRVEVLSGLKSGERVIRLGAYELADGQKIKTEEEKGKGGEGEKAGDSRQEAGGRKSTGKELGKEP